MFKPLSAMNSNTSIETVLYTSKKYSNGESPILLRAIKDRQPKYTSTGYRCHPQLWNKKKHVPKKKHPNAKKLSAVLNKQKAKLLDIILDFEQEEQDFTLDELFGKYTRKTKKITIFQYLDQEIDRLTENNKIGTANTRKDLKRALTNFCKRKDLLFTDITIHFLNSLEGNFLKRGVKETSISVYMRTLRAVVNKAIEEGYLKAERSPFKQYKISKFNTKTQKRALSAAQMHQIMALSVDSTDTKLYDAWQYFLFSYYARGMNFADMAKLRWQDVADGRLRYIRSKNGKPFDLELLEPAQKILAYYRRHYGTEGYVFPILNERHTTAKSIKYRTKKVRGEVNENLKRIAQLSEVNGNMTTYVARHSWASGMYRKGVSIAVISESLGHDDEKTTRIYLSELGNKVLDEANRIILNNYELSHTISKR